MPSKITSAVPNLTEFHFQLDRGSFHLKNLPREGNLFTVNWSEFFHAL